MQKEIVLYDGAEFREYKYGYFASREGQVLSLKRDRPRILKPHRTPSGFLRVFLYTYRRRPLLLHWIVWLAWMDLFPFGQDILFIDGNRTNCRLSNLYLGEADPKSLLHWSRLWRRVDYRKDFVRVGW